MPLIGRCICLVLVDMGILLFLDNGHPGLIESWEHVDFIGLRFGDEGVSGELVGVSKWILVVQSLDFVG